MTIQAGARLAQIGTGTTAAERLRQAVGSSGVATAAALLVAWSGLASATAAEHLMTERGLHREVSHLSSPIMPAVVLVSSVA